MLVSLPVTDREKPAHENMRISAMEEKKQNDSTTTKGNDALIDKYSAMVREVTYFDPAMFTQYNVKRGLRNADGSGVLVGLTSVGAVIGYSMLDQELVPIPGVLQYRGLDVRDIVSGFQSEKRLGFEETVFLLLLGRLPNQSELDTFCSKLDELRPLPNGFKEEAILRMPSPDVMNKLARCVLASYAFDDNPDDVSVENVVRQSLTLISH